MDPKKIEAILKLLPPRTVKEILVLVGKVNYNRRWIKNASEILAPLLQLTQKDVEFNWTAECQQSFEEIKKILTSAPILRHADQSRQFILHADASNYAMGAALCQKDDKGDEYVVAYASRIFRKYEKNMSATEKEMGAVVFGVSEFEVELYGKQFVIETDHKALIYLRNIKDPVGKLARWAMYLSQFDFIIKYRKGSDNVDADFLSRANLVSLVFMAEENEVTEDAYKSVDPFDDDSFIYFMQHRKHKPGTPRKQINRIRRLFNKFDYRDGILYMVYKNSHVIVPRKR